MDRHDDNPRLDNPEMNRLVEELNRQRRVDREEEERFNPSPSGPGSVLPPIPRTSGLSPSAPPLDHSVERAPDQGFSKISAERGQRQVSQDSELGRILGSMVELDSSDLLLIPGCVPTVRIDGNLSSIEGESSYSAADLEALFTRYLGRPHRRALSERGSADLTLSMGTDDSGRRFRFRVNLHYQRARLAASIRCLPQQIPTLEELNLPSSLIELVRERQGLVLFCGPTGAGKSSTQAALLQEINRTRRAHVITIEQPVEYEHDHSGSLIEHVEVGFDAPSFAEALRSSLRQDPDVILVGEMRDLETIATAVTAAETGHLVLGTLHTHDAVQAIHRMVDVFPTGSKDFLRHQLSMSLNAILSQQLVPRRSSLGRVPACELLRATYPVRSHIRAGNFQKIYNEIVLGQRHGMMTLESSLANLVKKGLIDREEAEVRSRRPEELASLLASAQ